MFTVITTSGFEMILADAGKDSAGNQLWRQVKMSPQEREREDVRRLKSVDP